MSGMQSIIGLIEKKTSERTQAILRDAELIKEQKLREAREKAKGVEQSLINKAKAQAKAELTRHEAAARLRAKQHLLSSKETLMAEALKSARETAFKVVGTKQYDQILTRLAIDAAQRLNATEVEIVLPEGQSSGITTAEMAKAIKQATGVKTEVTVAKNTVRAAGGVLVVTKDKKKWVDNTFEARLERLHSELTDKIAHALFAEKKA
jgi:V/A-type H+-transporting ATPase subunit E